MPFLAIPRADDPAPLPTLSGLPQKIPYDTRHIPEMGIVALKIYAFGGLAFMIGTVLAAVSYWFWVVVIKQEYADSPPWLDLHPERMRAREVARIARLKARKEEKRKERERREQEKFSPPPLRITKRTNAARPRASTTVPVVGFTNPPPAPPRSPAHKAMHTPLASTARPRKSSLSSPNTPKGRKPRRVSWASSTATLDVNGVASEKPIEPKSESDDEPAASIKAKAFEARRASESTLLPIPSLDDAIRRVPQARAATRRVSVSIDPRARTGRAMIAVTTPDVATAWSKPADQVERCRRWSTADPLNEARSRSEINRY